MMEVTERHTNEQRTFVKWFRECVMSPSCWDGSEPSVGGGTVPGRYSWADLDAQLWNRKLLENLFSFFSGGEKHRVSPAECVWSYDSDFGYKLIIM